MLLANSFADLNRGDQECFVALMYCLLGLAALVSRIVPTATLLYSPQLAPLLL
jgi:hypothetical protein